MGNRPASFKQSDVTRIVKGVVAAGIVPGRVLVRPDGAVEIIPMGSQVLGLVGPDPDELLK